MNSRITIFVFFGVISASFFLGFQFGSETGYEHDRSSFSSHRSNLINQHTNRTEAFLGFDQVLQQSACRIAQAALYAAKYNPDFVGDGPANVLLNHAASYFDQHAAEYPRRGVAIDVGVNTGQEIPALIHAVHNRPSGYDVFGFEPNPGPWRRAQSLKTEHVHILNLAVSEKSGKATFYENAQSSDTNQHGGLGLYEEPDVVGRSQTFEVDVVTLEDFCRSHGVEHIDILKVDTEGFDMSVIRGLGPYLRHVDVIIFECSYLMTADYAPKDSSLENTVRLLEFAGFMVFKLGNYNVLRMDHGYWDQVYEKDKPWSSCMAVPPHSELLDVFLSQYPPISECNNELFWTSFGLTNVLN